MSSQEWQQEECENGRRKISVQTKLLSAQSKVPAVWNDDKGRKCIGSNRIGSKVKPGAEIVFFVPDFFIFLRDIVQW